MLKKRAERNQKVPRPISKRKLKSYMPIYMMLFPVMLFYIMFCIIPMFGITIAFKDFDVFKGIFKSPWADNYGFEYFIKFLKDPYFWTVTKNTIIISLYKLIFSFPIPIILALLMNEMVGKRYKRCVQTVLYLPRFISWVIVGGLVIAFLSPTTGIINKIVELCGGDPTYFILQPKYFRTIVVISDIWKNAGWGTIIYMAALTGINSELYEAAKIDGAGRLRQMWNVSLPGIKATIIMMFILQLSSILNAGFDQIFVLYNPKVYDVGDIIDTYVYRMGIKNGQYAYSTAVGLFKSVIGFVLILGSDKFFKKIGEHGIL